MCIFNAMAKSGGKMSDKELLSDLVLWIFTSALFICMFLELKEYL
jgi:hypothetical protein